MASSDWRWNGADASESIVVPAVQAVAVYTNPDGEIVIRQQDPTNTEDAFIVLPRSTIPKLIKALKAEAAKPFTPSDSD